MQPRAAAVIQDSFYLTRSNGLMCWLRLLAARNGLEYISLTHRQRMATVASISPWHMSSQVSATMKSWWGPSLRIPASQPLSKTIEELNQWRPEVLVSYASMAGILAEEQLAHRLHLQPKAGVCCIRSPYIANQKTDQGSLGERAVQSVCRDRDCQYRRRTPI